MGKLGRFASAPLKPQGAASGADTDTPIRENGDPSCAEADLGHDLLISKVSQALSRLSDTQRDVVVMRFGIHSGIPASTRDLAPLQNAPSVVVEQRIDEALRMLAGYGSRSPVS